MKTKRPDVPLPLEKRLIRAEVLRRHSRMLNGQWYMMSGIVTLPDDDETRKLIDNGYLRLEPSVPKERTRLNTKAPFEIRYKFAEVISPEHGIIDTTYEGVEIIRDGQAISMTQPESLSDALQIVHQLHQGIRPFPDQL